MCICSSNNTSPRSPTSGSLTANQNANSSSTLFPLPAITPDVSDYLRDFPTEWLADSSQFLSQTLQWAGLLPGAGGLSQYDSLNDPNINAVMQGKKEVRAPPGERQSACNVEIIYYTIECNMVFVINNIYLKLNAREICI